MKLWRLASWLTASFLLLFTVRRWLFMLTALLPERRRVSVTASSFCPTVAILVPLRNEYDTLLPLLAALGKLNYPANRLTILLIDDGSTDGSAFLLTEWAALQENRFVYRLPANVGKAQALNQGLTYLMQTEVSTAAPPEVVVIYDADERPQPDALRHLVALFADRQVGAVSGQRAVSNCLASPIASYTTFEGLVHQWITMRAKDRLNLAPAVLGANCAYRLSALASVGAFKPGALLEDSDLSLKLPQAGWSIRFTPQAVSYHQVPQTISGYWQQHTRWARGFSEVAREQAGALILDFEMPPLLRLELIAFAVGYLDRVALLGATWLLLFRRWSRFPVWVLVAHLLTPLAQTVAALGLTRAPWNLWLRLFWLPLFFGVDIAMALHGVWSTFWQKPQIWEERRGRH